MKWVCVLPLFALFSTVQGYLGTGYVNPWPVSAGYSNAVSFSTGYGDVVCKLLLRGVCQAGSTYCSGKSVPHSCGMYGSDPNCCVPKPEPKCTKRNGTCQDTSVPCFGGQYFKGLCSGPSSRRCCVPLGLGGCPIASKGLACQLLNDSNIDAYKSHPGSGKIDDAYAYNNLRDMCFGAKASRSSYWCIINGKNCTAPGGETCLSYDLLDYLVQLAKGGKVTINELAGACHSCSSKHYSGLAVDLHKNGRESEYLEMCKKLGTYRKNENNHVHCGFSDGDHPNWG